MKQETITWHTVEEKEPPEDVRILISWIEEGYRPVCIGYRLDGIDSWLMDRDLWSKRIDPTDLWAEVRGPQ